MSNQPWPQPQCCPKPLLQTLWEQAERSDLNWRPTAVAEGQHWLPVQQPMHQREVLGNLGCSGPR